MMPRDHLIASAVISIIYYPFFGFWSLLALVGGFLIDVDHYLEYIVRFGDFNMLSAVDFYSDQKKCGKYKDLLNIFHTVEFWILFIVLALLHPVFLPFTLSFFVHLAMDFYGMWKQGDMFQRAIFLSYWFIKKFNLS